MAEMLQETIRIRADQRVKISMLGISLSEWVRDQIDKLLMGEETLKRELKVIREKEKQLKEELKKYKGFLFIESAKEKEFLLDTKRAVAKEPQCLNPRLNRYRNEFNKPYFPKEVFLKKLDRI